MLAIIQYKKVTPNINPISLNASGASPIAAPSAVNGTAIPTKINNVDEIYTAL